MSEDAKAIMADDAGESHIRLVYFLANGCTKLARNLVNKLVELSKPKDHTPVDKRWSLDDFLHENMSKLLAHNKNDKTWKQLSPGFQKEANMEDWDLNILCHVIMTCTNNQHVIQDIKQLKNLRNELYHIGNTNIEIKRYERQIEIIEVVVQRCCAFINKSNFTHEMDTLLNHFKKGQIVTNDEDLQKIRHWYETDPVSELLSKVDGLSEDHKVMIYKLDELTNLLTVGFVLPDTNVELIVKNCNKDKESVICQHLVELLDSKIEKDMPEEYKVKVRQALKEAMSQLLSGGRKVTDKYVACVNLVIKCPTFENMRDLWMDCMTGKMTRVFNTVEKYIRELTECPALELEVGITHFEFYRVFEDTVMAIEQILRPDNADVNTDQKEVFNELTDASLSDAVTGSPSLFQSYTVEPIECSTREGTQMVLRVQPSTFSQAEKLWEACHSGRFNKKLEKLSQAFQQVYGCEDLRITGRMEEASPYKDIFRNKIKYTDNEEDEDVHMEDNNDIADKQKIDQHGSVLGDIHVGPKKSSIQAGEAQINTTSSVPDQEDREYVINENRNSDIPEAISEGASSHSVGSQDLENDDNDNFSDMISANVSGRGTPNISGRDTPLSQAESGEQEPQQHSHPPLPETIQKKNRVDVTEKFGKFDIKQELEYYRRAKIKSFPRLFEHMDPQPILPTTTIRDIQIDQKGSVLDIGPKKTSLNSVEAKIHAKFEQQSIVQEDIKNNLQTNTDQLKTLTDQIRQIPGTSSGTEFDQQRIVQEDITSNLKTNIDQLKTKTDQLKIHTDQIRQIPWTSSGTETIFTSPTKRTVSPPVVKKGKSVAKRIKKSHEDEGNVVPNQKDREYVIIKDSKL